MQLFCGRNLQILSVKIAISRLTNPKNEDFKVFGSLCHCLEQGLVDRIYYQQTLSA